MFPTTMPKLGAKLVFLVALVLWCSLGVAIGGTGGWVLGVLLSLGAFVLAGYLTFGTGVFFEWRVERAYQAVCKGVGLGRDFTYTSKEGHLQSGTVAGKLRVIERRPDGFVAMVQPLRGQTIADYQRHEDAFAEEFRVPFVRFERDDSGWYRLTVGTGS